MEEASAAGQIFSGLQQNRSPPHRSLPEGVRFVLNTLPVNRRCVGDGDGFTAHVESRMAGDTNNRDPEQYRIRMRGIDAPELKMKYGVESKNELVKLIGGKCVEILVYGTDQYGRYLGDIYCDGVFIQEQMLKRGFAWHFKICDKRPEFANWEREAKVARRGLWSLDNPQKPWDWRRDQRINNQKENADDIQVESQSQVNGSSVTLPYLIKKDMENLGRKWKENLENFVSDNMKLHDQVQELKREKKEAEDRAKKSEKEMQSVVADIRKLKDQLQVAEDRAVKLKYFSESVAAVNMDLHEKLEELKNKNKKAEERDKESENEMEIDVADNRKLKDQLQVAEDRALKLKYFSESVAAVNMDLHDKLEELKNENKKADDRAKESKNEMESVVADNRKLKDQLQVAEDRAVKLKYFSESVAAVNMDLHDKLKELKNENKKAEDRAKESENEMESVVTDNRKLKDQLQVVEDRAVKLKYFSESVAAINMDLHDKLEELKKKNKMAEERAKETEKEMEIILDDNMELNVPSHGCGSHMYSASIRSFFGCCLLTD